MTPVDQIIEVAISRQTAAVPQAGFGIPVIMGLCTNASWLGVSLYAAYSSADDMLSDGFLSSDQEYKRAVKLTSQDLKPTQFLVASHSVPVAQIDTITPIVTLQEIQHFIATIDGVPYDFTSDATPTAGEVVTGLKALINADSACKAAATGTSTLVLTGKTEGDGFTTTVSANLTLVHTLGNHSITDDIAALRLGGTDIWYALLITSQLAANIEQVSAYIEGQKKIFIADSNDAGIISPSSTTDVAYTLEALGYDRTALLYAGSANDSRAAAWVGGQVPQTPGSNTWMFKTLQGIIPDSLTQTQRLACIGTPTVPGKNCNIYEEVGGVAITENGFVVSGEFIDVTIGIDWLVSEIQTNVYRLLTTEPKIPYTDQGAGQLELQVRKAMLQGATNGLIDKLSIVVTATPVLDISDNYRAARYYPGLNFSCRLAGAFHHIVVNGVVTV